MYKLVILIEPLEDWLAFDEGWPEFLARAENMPGLISETTSRVDSLIHGHFHVAMIHELFFDSMEAARTAMTSEEGREAGGVLQAITRGKVTLLLADHLEDELANIKSHLAPEGKEPPGDKA